MKKSFSVLLVTALLLAVLAGCQSTVSYPPAQEGANQTVPAPQESVPPTAEAPADTQPAEAAPTYITPEEAKAIALQDAGLAEADVRDLEVELDLDDGPAHYDVDFEKGNADYDYDIDAVTGEILRVEKPAQKAADKPASTTTAEKKQLSKTEARDIALKHAGLKASEVRDLEVELDRDDGKVHYDVDFEKDGYDYDYEIDAYSGKILKSRKERD